MRTWKHIKHVGKYTTRSSHEPNQHALQKHEYQDHDMHFYVVMIHLQIYKRYTTKHHTTHGLVHTHVMQSSYTIEHHDTVLIRQEILK